MSKKNKQYGSELDRIWFQIFNKVKEGEADVQMVKEDSGSALDTNPQEKVT